MTTLTNVCLLISTALSLVQLVFLAEPEKPNAVYSKEKIQESYAKFDSIQKSEILLRQIKALEAAKNLVDDKTDLPLTEQLNDLLNNAIPVRIWSDELKLTLPVLQNLIKLIDTTKKDPNDENSFLKSTTASDLASVIQEMAELDQGLLDSTKKSGILGLQIKAVNEGKKLMSHIGFSIVYDPNVNENLPLQEQLNVLMKDAVPDYILSDKLKLSLPDLKTIIEVIDSTRKERKDETILQSTREKASNLAKAIEGISEKENDVIEELDLIEKLERMEAENNA